MNGYRLLQGFAVHVGDQGGAVGYIGNLRRWDHVLKDTLYATQEILGNAAGVSAIVVFLWHRYADHLPFFRYTDASFCGIATGGS